MQLSGTLILSTAERAPVSRPRPTLALLCVVLLAGCGGMLGSDTAAAPTPSNTPAPVPSDTATPDAVREVPRYSEDGIENPFALGRAHRAVLANASYTRRLTESTRFADGSLRLNTTAVTRVEPTNATTRSYSVTTYEGPVEPIATPNPTADRVEIYGDERFYVRFTFPGGTTTVRSLPRTFDGRAGTIESVIAAFNTTVRDRTACGDRTCRRVRSTELAAPWLLSDAVRLPDDWTVRNATLFALVDSRGLVHEYRIRYAVETPTSTYAAVRRVRYTALGETVVRKPDWVSRGTS